MYLPELKMGIEAKSMCKGRFAKNNFWFDPRSGDFQGLNSPELSADANNSCARECASWGKEGTALPFTASKRCIVFARGFDWQACSH